LGNRKLTASIDEKQEAGKALCRIFFNGKNDDRAGNWLQEHLERRAPGVEKILASEYGSDADELPYEKLPRTLVDMFGSEIFEGTFGNELRDKILEKLFDKGEYRTIFDIFLSTAHTNSSEIEDMKVRFSNDRKGDAKKYVEKLQEHQKHPWFPGGVYARRFVQKLRLADIFAGIHSDPKPGRLEEAVPKAKVPELKNFQKNMKGQIMKILEGSDENRAIVTLPTGAGKTRIAVEAIVEFLNKNGTERNILWIAQTREVCEQAVLCFKQIWEQRGIGSTLDIFRAWDKNDIPTPDERGIIVSGFQKLISQKDKLHHLSDDGILSAVFIDEAHHSVAKSYGEILKGLGISAFPEGCDANDRVPLIGITATPERRKSSETNKLWEMYGEKRIYPSDNFEPVSENGKRFGEEWKKLQSMKEKLTELKYLAKAEFTPIDPGKKIHQLDEEETMNMKVGGEHWIERIATEAERNKNIKNEIIKWAKKGKKILYFGTNVSQSNAMARILENENISSVCITGDTRYATRKLYVDTFNEKDNKIQVMCNYNVLSTGFDSPQIDTVIIARPTTSIVSYQQMIGRGLRGEEFGGKEGNRCDIVTVRDNILTFNDELVELGYSQYQKVLEQID